MVSSVNTNINALAAVHALSDISNSMTMTQAHIQSGLKVSQSSDNPAVFTIAQGLRANIGALSAVSDSLQTGVATVQGASAGAVAISNALKTLVQTVTQAQGQTGDALAASQTTVTNALKNIDAYAAASTVNGVNLLNGTAASAGPPAVAAAPTAGSTLDVLSSVAGDSTTITTATASNSAGLGFTGGTLTLGTGSAADIKTAITAVNLAIKNIGINMTALGAATVQLQGLADFTSKLSTSVTTGLGAMVDANLSEESAKLSSLQTKQSLAIQSLSIANQGPGALLQLFR